jgi:hypothetical protein
VAVVTDSGARPDTGVLEITPTGSISDYYGNTGISSDDDQSCADLDGDGYSFSAGALAKAGVTAGGTVTSGGVSFSWPAICQPDNVLAAGQTILLAGKSGARTIGFRARGHFRPGDRDLHRRDDQHRHLVVQRLGGHRGPG